MSFALSISVKESLKKLYFQDERRFGFHTKYSIGLTARDKQLVCIFRQFFKNVLIFWSFFALDGNTKIKLELPNCNADTFQLFLNEVSTSNPNEFKIMVLDNRAFHKAKCTR